MNAVANVILCEVEPALLETVRGGIDLPQPSPFTRDFLLGLIREDLERLDAMIRNPNPLPVPLP